MEESVQVLNRGTDLDNFLAIEEALGFVQDFAPFSSLLEAIFGLVGTGVQRYFIVLLEVFEEILTFDLLQIQEGLDLFEIEHEVLLKDQVQESVERDLPAVRVCDLIPSDLICIANVAVDDRFNEFCLYFCFHLILYI